ncbi:aminotransferase, class I/II [Winkia neuii]|nr:aminotransferase, class I/II [Winkia neuii]OFJ70522.1 hypothetical protein HMPREF2851_00285 [Actinomyces sp. HMSC064C12]
MDSLSIEVLRRRATKKWAMRLDGQLLDGAWIAEADFGTAPEVEAALSKAIANNFLGYMPSWLVERTLHECCRFQGEEFGFEIAEECFGIAPNVLSVLHQTIEVLTDPGTPVIVPTPAYMPFLSIPGLHNREVIEIPSPVSPQGRYQLDLGAIAEAFARGAQLLVLCNPWNPTGQTFTSSELAALAEVLSHSKKALVFSDEIHSPLILPGNRHVPFASVSALTASRTVTATAASKGWNIPGLNCAQWYVVDPLLRERFAPAAEKLSEGATPLGALAATVAYSNGRPWLNDLVAYVAKNASHLQRLLANSDTKLHFSTPQATYLSWFDASAYQVEDPAAQIAARGRVAVNAGSTLGKDYSQFFRFNLASPTNVLEDMAKRVIASF